MKEKILKGKVTKRLLSAVLVLTMVFTAIPAMGITVLAATTTDPIHYDDEGISVDVTAIDVTGAITAGKDESDGESFVGDILALDDDDSETGTACIPAVSKDTSKIIATGIVKVDDENSEDGKTTVTVTFPTTDNFDSNTQQLVFKVYNQGESDFFDYYYPSVIDGNQDGMGTVTVTYNGIMNWILAAIDKNVQLLNFRDDEYAKTVETDGATGNEKISMYGYYSSVEQFELEYTFDYNRSACTLTYQEGNDEENKKVYTTDDNGVMAYFVGEDYFDLLGRMGGDWKRVTYSSTGYFTYLKVGGEPIQLSDLSGENQIEDTGLKVGLDCSIVGANGQIVKATYTVTNESDEEKEFSLGSGADVQIGNDDNAPIAKLTVGEDKKHVGLFMTSTQVLDQDSQGNYASLAFICQNNGMVTDVDTLWYGYYNYYSTEENMFGGTVKDTEFTDEDSGMSYSWMNRTIGAGETKVYRVLFGIGDIEKIIDEVEVMDESHTWCYTADASTIIATRDDGKTVSLTLSATSPTYSGSAISKDTLFSGMDFSAFNTATGQTLSTSDIKLYASTDTSKTNELSQIEAAGNYVADLTVEGATATCNVTVSSTPTQGGGGNSNPPTPGGGNSNPPTPGGGNSNPSTPGGGDSKPSTPTENYIIPVKNENTVKVEAEIKDGKANVSEITVDTIDKVVNNKNAESKVDTITIDLSGAKQEVTGVTLSKKSVETLAETTADKDNGIETATIELSKATVVLDNKTLETLVDQAKGSQIELVVADTKQNNLNTAQQTTLKDYQVATTFEAYFSSNGQRIHDFNGGKAIVSVDFKPETGKSTSYYHMVYVADDGKISRYKTKYESGRLMFTTTHFSDYAVIYDTSEKNATEENTDVTLDTTYRKLRLRVPTSTKTTNVLKWNKVSDADGYVIYGAPCNTKTKVYTMEKQVTIKNGSTTTWTDKSLTSGTYYKYYIKAYKLVDGKKVWLAKSKVVHSTTTGGEYGNAKSVKVNKTSVSLAVGKTFTIKAEQVVKDQPIKKHTEIKFESSNSKIASVTSKGVIKAKKKGTCYIYVYAQNGMYKRIKVTVK